MFKVQHAVLETLPALRELFDKHARPGATLDAYAEKTRGYAVRVPVVGAFSAGKSTLLNTWLGEPLFATALNPETAVPAEIAWGEYESIIGCSANGRRSSVTREELSENRLDGLHPDGWVQVALPVQPLAALPHLRVVDMPGWDSGLAGHKRAIDGYASRSLAYVVVVSAEEGALRESIRDALAELGTRGLPIVAVISKSEKKTEEDCAAVARNVAREIEVATGKAPLRVAIVSSRKRDIAQFAQALGELEALAEPLFVATVVEPLIGEIKGLRAFLATLANRDNLDGEKIASELAKLAREIEAFDRELDRETGELEKRANEAMKRIVQRVDASLSGQTESFARQAINGADVSERVENAIRLAVAQGITEDFAPEIRRYCDKVTEAIPLSIRPAVRIPGSGDGLNIDLGTISSTLAVVAPLLVVVPVVGPIIGTAMKYLLPALLALGGKGNREVEEARRREDIADTIRHDVIPSAVQQTRQAIEPVLRAQIEEAKQAIVQSVQAQREALTDALEQARRNGMRQQAEFEALLEQYREDAAAVDAMLVRLGAASE